jgi:hypothetical protein
MSVDRMLANEYRERRVSSLLDNAALSRHDCLLDLIHPVSPPQWRVQSWQIDETARKCSGSSFPAIEWKFGH